MITRFWVTITTVLLGLVLITVPSAASPTGTGIMPGRAPQKILIMGSSTTGCSGPSAVDKCYVNLVKQARPNDTFTVLGRGGTYIGWGEAATNWTETPIPGGNQTVVIQLGVNDWYVPVEPGQLGTAVAGLLGRVRAANPGASIIWLRTWMPAVSEQNFAVRQAMWRAQGVTTRTSVKAVGGRWIEVDPYGDEGGPFRADSTGWHYNDEGHARLAAAVLSVI